MKNADLIFDLLGISSNVPLTEPEMARELRVTFLPPHSRTERTKKFSATLKETLAEVGVEVVPIESAMTAGNKVKPGIVIIEEGDAKDGNLGIDYVSGLYQNPIIGINDGKPPIPDNADLQETLDSIVSVLAWNLAHVPVFVEDDRWTICTMNGAIVRCGDWRDPAEDVINSLVPKLSAQVVPPKRDEIVYREKVFDAVKNGYGGYIDDFMSSAKVWKENGLMIAHTKVDDLEYRNRYYKRIVSRYLDNRTGMSYGFMVKQLPVDVEPAVELDQADPELQEVNWKNQNLYEKDGITYSRIELLGKEWIVKLPDVWVLSTRSGCNKTNLNPEKDILRLGLQNGEITIETPMKIGASACRPSYDTFAILAHGMGNIIIASILLALDPDAQFPAALKSDGLSISHWHGYPDVYYPLSGYLLHGHENPPVSCSTPQSAAYALSGKITAIEEQRPPFGEYRGDVHVEPHHGTNITGVMTLTESAEWVDRMHKGIKTDSNEEIVVSGE
jgi:hypothetical protein